MLHAAEGLCALSKTVFEMVIDVQKPTCEDSTTVKQGETRHVHVSGPVNEGSNSGRSYIATRNNHQNHPRAYTINPKNRS
jgi:hypothetical protein